MSVRALKERKVPVIELRFSLLNYTTLAALLLTSRMVERGVPGMEALNVLSTEPFPA